ncbi:MAG: Hsp33 family molecular chaperone HslO [Defluviitaleaceae bacterium]|nr:Hsp33 family molecular chaperone HslO [Defluviitaleaceae bacterium]
MDYILHATIDEVARVFIATTKNLVEEARKTHETTPVVTAALGRLLTAGAIMGATLKNETDLLTLQIKGDGLAKGLVVTADNKSRVKGYPHNSHVDIPLKPNGKLDVSTALGFGELRIIKDIGLKEAVTGSVELISGEIAEDITYYYAKSEQTPSSVALGVLVDRDYTVKQAGGFIIQLLAGTDEETKEALIIHLESVLASLPPVTTMLEQGLSPEDILKKLFPTQKINIHRQIEPSFYCNCSRERMTKALIAIGEKELRTMQKEDGGAVLNCHFCKKSQNYTINDLEDIIQNL